MRRLLRWPCSRAGVQVHDGAGQLMLQGALDDDGECEAAWPHAAAPASYLQQHGASFVVTPAGQR
jgi:hypothetical protein